MIDSRYQHARKAFMFRLLPLVFALVLLAPPLPVQAQSEASSKAKAKPKARAKAKAKASAPAAAPAASLTPQELEAQKLTPAQRELRAIYKELVEINTTDSAGSCTVAAKAMAARLRKGGYGASEIEIIVPQRAPTKGNLIVRLKGNGEKKPLLLLAHLDVVEAKREDWTRDPFKLAEEGGYFYARGAFDNKAQASVWVANMLRYKREKTSFKRDLIMALTCDEEMVASEFNGVDYLLKNEPTLLDAELALTEGASIALDLSGRPVSQGVMVGEKAVQGYTLEVSNKGGHSSMPVRDNAIVHLSNALSKVGAFDFPFRLTPTTRTFFERTAKVIGAPMADDMRAILGESPDMAAMARLTIRNPFYYASVRTTCVPTMVTAGHAENALPQRATAVVNCRILEGDTTETVQETLARNIGNPLVKISPIGKAVVAPSPPLDPVLMAAVEELTTKFWPGLPVIPVMAVGATDGRFLNAAGIPTYGVSGLYKEADGSGLHGLNERLRVKSLYESQAFLDALTVKLAQ